MPVRFRPRAVLGCGDNTDEEKTEKSRVRPWPSKPRFHSCAGTVGASLIGRPMYSLAVLILAVNSFASIVPRS